MTARQKSTIKLFILKSAGGLIKLSVKGIKNKNYLKEQRHCLK